MRGGLSVKKPGRVPFEWIIDGEEGTIKLESDSSFYHVAHPKNVYINGEKWEPQDKLVDLVGNLASDRKSTRLNSSHSGESRMPSSA